MILVKVTKLINSLKYKRRRSFSYRGVLVGYGGYHFHKEEKLYRHYFSFDVKGRDTMVESYESEKLHITKLVIEKIKRDIEETDIWRL